MSDRYTENLFEPILIRFHHRPPSPRHPERLTAVPQFIVLGGVCEETTHGRDAVGHGLSRPVNLKGESFDLVSQSSI